MSGLHMMGNSFDQLQKIANLSKAFAGNHTRMLEEIQHLRVNMHHESANVASSMSNLKLTLSIVGVLCVFTCCALGYLLRDEYRQAQLRKKGYGTVPQATRS